MDSKAFTILAVGGAVYLLYTYYKRKKSGITRPAVLIKSYRITESVKVEKSPKTESKAKPNTVMLSQSQIRLLQTKLNQFRISGELGKLIDPLLKYLAAYKEKKSRIVAIQDFRVSFSELKITGKYDEPTRIAVKALKVYLNVVKKANLVVDDNYDAQTDILTQWNIFKAK